MLKDLNDRTLVAIELAKMAGNEILKVASTTKLNIKDKGINDVVTIADFNSEKIIIEGIQSNFPDDGIISEETKNAIATNKFTWVIDPLDGTMNFSRGIPFYCVSIGYMKDGKPEGGAIFIPKTNELYFCEKGKGSYCNNKKLFVSNVSMLSKSLGTLGFNNRYLDLTNYCCSLHNNMMHNMLNVEKLFSTVISLCYVASGKLEAHAEIYCYLWDLCVGSLLVEEAGGKVCNEFGADIDFSKIEKHIIIGTNSSVHNEFVNKIIKND